MIARETLEALALGELGALSRSFDATSSLGVDAPHPPIWSVAGKFARVGDGIAPKV